MSHSRISDLYQVLLLFLIPIGGGIPGGVLLAQSRSIGWPVMVVLYFISDVILALVFEPLLKIFVFVGQKIAFMRRFVEVAKAALNKSVARYGVNTGPLMLILIAFGVDPMTGRAASAASGHGFVTGWMLAITGDMFYFTLIMVCTLWLRSILGDGTWATLIILVLTIVVPIVIKRIRARLALRRRGPFSEK